MNVKDFWQRARSAIFLITALIVSLLAAIFLLPFFIIILAVFFLVLWRNKQEMEKARKKFREKNEKKDQEGTIIEVFPIEVKPYTSTKDDELEELIDKRLNPSKKDQGEPQ